MSLGFRFVLVGGACFALGLSMWACGDDTVDGSPTSAVSGSSSSSSSGTGGAGQPLLVLEWNTHNFFDDQNNSSAPDETVVSTATYQKHLTDVSKIIAEVDPDIVILAEIENQQILAALNQKLGDKYPEQQITDGNDPRGINVAALSKTPFSSVVSHKDDAFTQHGTPAPSYKFARDAVEYHLTKNGRNMVFLGVHFKSKDNDDPVKRLAEAEHASDIAAGLAADDPTAAIAILGDFNDLPDSDPWNAIAGSGDGAFTDAASFVAQADRWTFNFNGSHELIDHVMMNPILDTLVDQSAQTIRHGADVDAASDHAPIITTFLVK